MLQTHSQKQAEHNSWAFCNTQEINKAKVPREHITDLIQCVLHGHSVLAFLPFFFFLIFINIKKLSTQFI